MYLICITTNKKFQKRFWISVVEKNMLMRPSSPNGKNKVTKIYAVWRVSKLAVPTSKQLAFAECQKVNCVIPNLSSVSTVDVVAVPVAIDHLYVQTYTTKSK